MVDILPDSVLLEIFRFCLCEPTEFPVQRASDWQILVHVCQRWRRIIFASPRQLNLNLNCSNRTPVRKNLAFWPVPLLLTLDYTFTFVNGVSPVDEDNVVAALEHPKRLHRIAIRGPASLIRKVVTVMRKAFPALIHLDLNSNVDNSSSRLNFPVIPKIFLGRSSSLQYLHLRRLSFPQLPMFLLSACNLVTLKLEDMPPNGYISPEAMVGSLSALTKLTTLSVSLHDRTFSPDKKRSYPDHPIRTILPALTALHYEGRNWYLEDFLARIDTPRLDQLKLKYFVDRIQALQLSQFIKRTENLHTGQFTRADVIFSYRDSDFKFERSQGNSSQAQLGLNIIDRRYLKAQVRSVAAVLGELTLFSNVDTLFAHGDSVNTREICTTDWQPFFCLFPAVRALRLSGGVAASIVSALEDTTEDMATDVFPALPLIGLVGGRNGYFQSDPVGSIEQFLSLRQLAGRPVAVVNTKDEFDEAVQSLGLLEHPVTGECSLVLR
jgi:hypothetical protein